jgi:surface antigen
MNKFYKFSRLATCLTIITLVTACASGGGGVLGNSGNYGLGSTTNSSSAGLQDALINAIIQSMSSNVLNGQIGSQLTPTDQNFRLQQLGSVVQSGAITQSQQWVNPQTGNTLLLNPVGQQTINPQTQQQCRNLEETMILQNGQHIKENRLACLDTQTGRWNLVQ